LSQPTPHPHHVSQLLEPALTDIVRAISDRTGQTAAEYEAKAEDTWILIESFQPRDAIDLMLTGQLIAFNTVFADATRDVLHGMADTIKQRTQSSLIAMGRLTQGHLDRLAKRGSQPYQTEVAAPQPAQRPAPTAKAPAAEPPHQPPVVATRPASPEPVPLQALSDSQPPPAPEPTVSETSWQDEPYQESVRETPAALAAQQQVARTAAVFALVEATNWAKAAAAARTAAEPDLDLPSASQTHPPTPTMAVAGD
jgi:hypothetical protein